MTQATDTANKKQSNLKNRLLRIGPTRMFVTLILLLALGYLVLGLWRDEEHDDHDHDDAVAEAAEDIEGDVMWTCSMHPQIRAEEFGLCPICNMDLIPVSEDDEADAAKPRRIAISDESYALLDIQTSPVERRFVEMDIRQVGKVAIDETRLANIAAWVPGRIEHLYVDFTGVQVREGDHMVSLYSPELLTAQEELRAAARTLESVRSGAPDTLRRTAERTLEATRSRLRRWGLTEAQVAEAEAGEWHSDEITIYAPIGGTVVERKGAEGMYVDVGTPIYTIADLSQVWVMLEAYESDLTWIHYGQPVSFTAESLPGEVFEGVVSFIEPVLNPATRTVRVRVNVDNPEGRLKPEMFVQGHIRSQIATGGRVVHPELAGKWISPMHPEVVKDGPGACTVCGMPLVPAEDLGYVPAQVSDEDKPLIIPKTAPLITGKRAVVYVAVPNTERPSFEGREIVLGPRAGDYYLVTSGLEPDERVVTHGTFKIDSALQVMAKPSMMDPEALFNAWDDEPLEGIEFALLDALEMLMDRSLALAEIDRDETTIIEDAGQTLLEHFDAFEPDMLTPEAQGYWSEFDMKLRNNVQGLIASEDRAERAAYLADVQRLAELMGAIFGLVEAPIPDAPETLQADIRTLFDAYMELQRPLADDDFDGAVAALPTLRSALEGVDASDLDGDALTDWEEGHESMRAALAEIENAEDLATMRVPFEPLSDTLIVAIRDYGITPGSPVYVVHCPMAFDFEGANWLQHHDSVLNAYFGDEMLQCGTVESRLYAGDDGADETHEHEEVEDMGMEGHDHG